ncbi:peptidoglycan recognition protein family protein [Glycomyces sp. A-F 0318]|uniref:peptidoglycan recognition protein family protein n=1 Tax=Glycomyces amatae TaxID=2881355 RepID=UPI001E5D6854|nr:peptidoglycan recognition family protein [Glycomyces amatae]MCD0447382.1 peptidoglycan recognition protein family protein [Glycomyces amatae]
MASDQRIRRRILLGTGAAGLLGAAGAAALGASANADTVETSAVEPDVDATAEWGARPPNGTNPVVTGSPDKLIVHHTVSANTGDFSREQAHFHARWVQDLHMDGNGWRDSGYNFVVSRGGWITEGTTGSLAALLDGGRFVQGIHTSGQNGQALGISNEGAYHDGAEPTAAQWESLVTLCAFACEQYGIASAEIYGHMDFNSTLCPGIFHDRLPQLREEVEAARGR